MGISKTLGFVEEVLESELKKLLGGVYIANATLIKNVIRVSLEDWTEHDPSVGVYGGPVCTFDIKMEDGFIRLSRPSWVHGIEKEQREEILSALDRIKDKLMPRVQSVFARY